MGSIERRANGKWRARWRDPNGRTQSRVFDRKVDAERFLTTVAHDKLAGTYVGAEGSRITFAQWAAEYFATTPKRATTLARDRRTVDYWMIPALGDLPLASITPRHVRALVDEMQRTLQPTSVRTYYGVLRAMMNAAVEIDLIARSPCRGIRLPKDEHEQPRFLSMGELHRLADTMPDEYRAMVYIAGILGLRFSEVAGLQVKRLNFFSRTIAITETIAEVEGRLLVAPVKTKASRRTLSVPAPLMDMLAAHLAEQGRHNPVDYVFTAKQGGPLRINHFRDRVWYPAVKRAGLEGLTFHGLRHSAAGLMIELGTHPRVIQKRMGHASIRTTFDIYGSVLPEVDNEVTEGLGKLLEFSRVTSVSRTRSRRPDHDDPEGLTSEKNGGGERTRTAGLFVANEAL